MPLITLPASRQVFSDEQTVLFEKAGGGHFQVKVMGQWEKRLGHESRVWRISRDVRVWVSMGQKKGSMFGDLDGHFEDAIVLVEL